MLASSIPAKFPIPFGNSAGGGFIRSIPTASQIGINPGFASLTDGFPPLNFQPVAAGGVPPFGQDVNGLLNRITQWNQWQAAGGPVIYDGTFAAAIGGYPRGAVLQSALVFGNFWLSTSDNNTTDPDSSSATNWISPPGIMGTGSLSTTFSTTLPPGFVWAKFNFLIGSASSGGGYAAADAAPLFAWHWNNFPNSQCPVSGGRGANPAADFAANKTIQVLDLSGRGIIGTDAGSTRLFGIPTTSGNANNPGCVLGENLHSLLLAEIPSHTHIVFGTSAIEGSSHAHTGGGTTSGQSVGHTHTGSGTTSTDSPDHFHSVQGFGSGGANVAGGGSFNNSNVDTSGASARHTHTYSFTTSDVSADHSHTYGFTTTTENANHTHAINITTDSGTGGNGTHNTVHNCMTVNWILKL
jgi:hypothetical protein